MRRFAIALVAVVAFVFLLAVMQPGRIHAAPQMNQQSPNEMLGYTAEAAQAERDWEQKFRAIPSAQNERDYMQRLSARPHAVGQPYDRDNAEWLLGKYKSFGLDAHIETFQVLFPTPKDRAVELVAPQHFVAKLEEPTVPVDPTSNQHAEQLPTYNAYSIDGDVTGPLVYANYGVPADYEQLERLGVSVKGAIVITRYGKSWRGIKPKVAAEHGAIGCLIYSDPRDDGYWEGDTFPQGAWRPPDGVQRGSVMDMPIYPGDPLTPGVGAVQAPPHFDLAQVKTLTKIPVLPISYADAQPLVKALTGRMAPEEWRGALPFPYKVGSGAARVHLRVAANWQIKPLYDVIVRIPGSQYPDEWIVRGNHHDAWVNGAEDPISGQVAEMEEARALGELLKQGWKPKRTIIYAAWDGEEPGLLGSTEWAEAHADELRQHAAVYINTDGNGRGYVGMSGSHSLEKFMNGVAGSIDDPEKHMPVSQRLRLQRIERPPKGEDAEMTPEEFRKEARDRADLRIEALGSGSDYTVFLDHLGIASLDLGYGGEDGGGIYHSIYDDFYWYTHFSDTDFSYGRALSQTVGTAVMRLADADILPYDFTDFADTIKLYLNQLQKLAKKQHDDITERNREIQEGAFEATSDPKKPTVPPKAEPAPPAFNFAPLQAASDALTRAADHYARALATAMQSGAGARAAQINAALMQSERKLTADQGLPGRPWFKHQIYAPGFYTGYGVKTIPAVREALDQKRWQEVEPGINTVAQVLNAEAALIEQAAALLEGQ